MKYVISFFICILLSCSSDDGTNQDFQELDFNEIGKGALYGNGAEGLTEQYTVISNDSDWLNLQDQMDAVNIVSDAFTETDIDFNDYMLVAVFLEIKPSYWEVDINGIYESENEVEVNISDAGSGLTVISQPFIIVKIDKTDKPVTFSTSN